MTKDLVSFLCCTALVLVMSVVFTLRHTPGPDNMLLPGVLNHSLIGMGIVVLVGVVIGGFRKQWRWAGFVVSALLVTTFSLWLPVSTKTAARQHQAEPSRSKWNMAHTQTVMSNNMQTAKTYQFRRAWLTDLFGKPAREWQRSMEDGSTSLQIVEFPPQTHKGRKREHWTYVTNGMSERRMPWKVGPEGNPKKRIELMVYSAEKFELAVELLGELAKYPFSNATGLDRFHTMPFTHPQLDWQGLILLEPPCEPQDSDVQRLYPGMTEDYTFLLQIAGLKEKELAYAVKHGGKKFAAETFDRIKAQPDAWAVLVFDAPHEPFPLQ